jgi:TorA maturation chaperone TorD
MITAERRGAVDETDRYRSLTYTLLAQMLSRAPDETLLAAVRTLGDDATPFGHALGALAREAAQATPRTAMREYNALFIGVDRGELVPYASYYLTGFLNDRPLAHLRRDMQALGIERAPGIPEPEDHIASLCEIMAGLIAGSYAMPADTGRQKQFFEHHIATWADRFFSDLEGAGSARLYRPVGTAGRLFLQIEAHAFTMEPPPVPEPAGGEKGGWEQ